MIDPRCEKLADVLVNYSVAVKPGDWVLIQGDLLTAPMIEEIYRQVLRAGGHPNTQIGSNGMTETFYKEASDEQLEWISPFTDLAMTKADVLISLMGTGNTRHLNPCGPSADWESPGRQAAPLPDLYEAFSGKLSALGGVDVPQ